MTEAPVPTVLSMLICEKIITEAETNIKSLIGVFDRMNATEFPAVHGSFWIFTRISDAEGNYAFGMDIVHLESETVVAKLNIPNVLVPSRLVNADVLFHVTGIILKAPGTYEVQITANDVWVGRTVMTVVKVDP